LLSIKSNNFQAIYMLHLGFRNDTVYKEVYHG